MIWCTPVEDTFLLNKDRCKKWLCDLRQQIDTVLKEWPAD
jgi:hypothetical protein